jgi:hypothetical protein
VQAMSVNEWPEPATFTREAPSTARTSSSSEPGRAIRSGAQRCWRAQFVQASRMRPGGGYPAADSAAASTRSGIAAQCASASTGVSRR